MTGRNGTAPELAFHTGINILENGKPCLGSQSQCVHAYPASLLWACGSAVRHGGSTQQNRGVQLMATGKQKESNVPGGLWELGQIPFQLGAMNEAASSLGAQEQGL